MLKVAVLGAAGRMGRAVLSCIFEADDVTLVGAVTETGSEATFHALRVARTATGRRTIIKFQGCYHGWHDSVAMNESTPTAAASASGTR